MDSTPESCQQSEVSFVPNNWLSKAIIGNANDQSGVFTRTTYGMSEDTPRTLEEAVRGVGLYLSNLIDVY